MMDMLHASPVHTIAQLSYKSFKAKLSIIRLRGSWYAWAIRSKCGEYLQGFPDTRTRSRIISSQTTSRVGS